MTRASHVKLCALSAVLLAAAPASAQEFTQTFINPSFGGNPFYSEHLLGIAGIDRPAEPEDEAETPTTEELLVSQLRAGLAATTISQIQAAITAVNAGPFVPGAAGNTGNFVIGDQQISFVRTATETRVTFVNGRTGETTELVIPVPPSASGSVGTRSASAEQALTARPVAPLSATPLSTARSRRTGPVALFSAPLGRDMTSASAREGMLLAPPPLQ